MPARMVVGVDAHIDPEECSVLTEISGEFATPQRADVGIGPYSQVGKCIRIRREFLMIRCILPGGQSRPPLRTHCCLKRAAMRFDRKNRGPADGGASAFAFIVLPRAG